MAENLIWKESVFIPSGTKNIIIHDSVTSIGDGAFSYCSSLESITIPNIVLKEKIQQVIEDYNLVFEDVCINHYLIKKNRVLFYENHEKILDLSINEVLSGTWSCSASLED